MMKNPIIYNDGKNSSKEWRDKNDQLHREDGPAIIYNSGTKKWFQHGLCHREDGPAVVTSTGRLRWWIKGIEFCEKEYNQYLDSKIKLVCIMLKI